MAFAQCSRAASCRSPSRFPARLCLIVKFWEWVHFVSDAADAGFHGQSLADVGQIPLLAVRSVKFAGLISFHHLRKAKEGGEFKSLQMESRLPCVRCLCR